jgi:8-oxo-dGTP pyrophosphatase MutT (NUDIX family)
MHSEINKFTIRVYGLLMNEQNQVLLVHERMPELEFTKFPGGGLEFGEGTIDCLIREFKEETGLDVQVIRHLYTTDFFQQSAFRKTDQLMAIYYLLKSVNNQIELPQNEIVIDIGGRKEYLRFFWVDLNELATDLVSFPVDKLLISKIKSGELGRLA